MRIANQPLDPVALRMADDAFYAAHPELVHPGERRELLSASRADQAELRAEWIDLYVANGGSVSTLSQIEKTRRAESAAVAVERDFSTGGIGSAKTACGGKAPPIPRSSVASGGANPGEKQLSNTPACAISGVAVRCEHGRSAKDGVLDVVSHNIVAAGDIIDFTVSSTSVCAQHPSWTVDGARSLSGRGASGRFDASSWGASSKESPLDFEGRLPIIYRLRANACAGASDVTEIRLYPIEGQSISFSVDLSSHDGLAKGLETFAKRLGGKKPEANVGGAFSVTLTQQWSEEDKPSPYAVCTTVLGVSPYTWTAELKLPALVPPGTQAVKQYLRVGLFATLSVELGVSVDLTRQYKPAVRELTFPSVEGGVTLEGAVQFAFELYLWSAEVVNVVAGGKSSFGISAGLIGTSGSIDFAAKLFAKPLTLILTIQAVAGFIEYEKSYPLFSDWESEPWQAELIKLQ